MRSQSFIHPLYPSIPASQHPSIPAPQHSSTPASQHSSKQSITPPPQAPQHSSTPASQHPSKQSITPPPQAACCSEAYRPFNFLDPICGTSSLLEPHTPHCASCFVAQLPGRSTHVRSAAIVFSIADACLPAVPFRSLPMPILPALAPRTRSLHSVTPCHQPPPWLPTCPDPSLAGCSAVPPSCSASLFSEESPG